LIEHDVIVRLAAVGPSLSGTIIGLCTVVATMLTRLG
jgi:hypothetical protein